MRFPSNVSILVLGAVVGVVAISAATGCGSSGSATRATYDTLRTVNGLTYIVYEEGSGPLVEPGDVITVDYAGYLESGELFDTTLDSIGALHDFDRGGYPFEPLEVTIGVGEVIQGWDQGLTANMRVGGRRRLIIPHELGYGPSGSGTIPPRATLIFDVHVLSAE